VYDIHVFLSGLQKYVESRPHRQAIQALIDKIDLNLRGTTVRKTDTYLIHSLKEPILDQVRRIIHGDILKVIVVSPFFSQELSLYEKIASEFTEDMELILQPDNNNLPVGNLGNWKFAPKLRICSIMFKDNRYLHGKIVLFQTSSEDFLLTGSANFTESALMFPAGKGGNIEVAVIRRAPSRYFEYLFDSGMLSLKNINLKEVRPIIQPLVTSATSDFRILEASIKDNKLVIFFDYKPVGDLLKVKIHVDRLEKDFFAETTSNLVSIPLSSGELQALTTSSIVSLTLEDNGRKLLSDLRLIHNPLYFPEQFSALNTIIDEDERTWLFKILNRYANLPSFSYILPIIERMEEYGLFELKPIQREELLIRLQAKIGNIKPYSAKGQLIQLIDRFRQRHEKRMRAAMESKRVDQLQTLINSFLMINKLIIWMVRKGLQDVSYLRFVRKNVEELFNGKYINPADSRQAQIARQSKLLAYVVMLSHAVDYYQRNSSKFGDVTRIAKRNHVKDFFEWTFVSSMESLRKISESELRNDLKSITSEFTDVAPEIDFSVTTVLNRLNQMIQNVNTNPYERSSFALFQA